MLFLQGTRDALADLALLRPICEELAPRARLHVIEGADHGFHVPKRSGRSDAEVIEELAAEIERFAS
jgi:predicted alpha/beta-hydrolase family hydrolase